jgi:hypothetical protein
MVITTLFAVTVGNMRRNASAAASAFDLNKKVMINEEKE